MRSTTAARDTVPQYRADRISHERDELLGRGNIVTGAYIAALNIEHAYYEITNTYEAFEGLCFVDTLDIAEAKQAGFAFLNEANTRRVERQKRTPITVIIGNPPYNMGQKSETENNKNRSYKVIDAREPRQAVLDKPLSPLAHSGIGPVQATGNLAVALALNRPQQQPGACY